MIIGAMNNPHKKLIEQIHQIGEMNFDYLELTIEHPHARPEYVAKHKKEIMDAISSYNLGLLSHLPWYFSIAHPYERVQKAINTEIISAMQSAASLGAKNMTIHTELSIPPSAQGRKSMVKNSVDTLKVLNEKANQMGLELMLETIVPKSCTMQEYKQIFSEVDMKMTLDIGHVQTNYYEGFAGFWKEFSKRVGHVHLHDGKGENHLPLGAGKLDLEEIVAELKKSYDSTITLEVHSTDPHYLKYSRDVLEVAWFGKRKFEENKDYLYPPGYKEG
ncbi:MAG: sugar phosphate isomerase/epimerase family protein [Candidatus Micrarchaeia archaeon]|jgi:sugar phosphate isomerase/epimerase